MKTSQNGFPFILSACLITYTCLIGSPSKAETSSLNQSKGSFASLDLIRAKAHELSKSKTVAEELKILDSNISKATFTEILSPADGASSNAYLSASALTFNTLTSLYKEEVESVNIHQGSALIYGGDQGENGQLREKNSNTFWVRVTFKDQSRMTVVISNLAVAAIESLYKTTSREKINTTPLLLNETKGIIPAEKPVSIFLAVVEDPVQFLKLFAMTALKQDEYISGGAVTPEISFHAVVDSSSEIQVGAAKLINQKNSWFNWDLSDSE